MPICGQNANRLFLLFPALLALFLTEREKSERERESALSVFTSLFNSASSGKMGFQLKNLASGLVAGVVNITERGRAGVGAGVPSPAPISLQSIDLETS